TSKHGYRVLDPIDEVEGLAGRVDVARVLARQRHLESAGHGGPVDPHPILGGLVRRDAQGEGVPAADPGGDLLRCRGHSTEATSSQRSCQRSIYDICQSVYL